MRSFNHLSLKSKLIVPLVVFTGIIFVFSQGYVFVHSYMTQQENLMSRATVLATGVAHSLPNVVLTEDTDTAEKILVAFSADEDVIRVKLYTANGQLFSMYERQGYIAPVPTEIQRIELRNQGYSIDGEFIYLLVPVANEQGVIAHLRITLSKKSFQGLYNSTLSSGASYLLILAVSALVLYLMVEMYILKPVYNLSAGIWSYINNSRQSLNISRVGNDELGALVEAFNTMLDRINQRDIKVAHTLEKIEEEKAFANEVVETVKHALVVVNEKGEIIHFNGATCDIFRCTRAYIKGVLLSELFSSSAKDVLEVALQSDTELTDAQLWNNDPFGQQQLLNLTTTKLSKPGLVLFAIQDITEVEAAQRRQRLAAGVFENSQDGLIITNQNDIITMVNPSVSRLLGHSQDSLLGKRPDEIFDWQQFRSLMPTIKDAVLNFGQWQGEVWEQHKRGHKKVPLFVKASRIESSDKPDQYDFVYLLSDLSSDKEMERLEYLAHHDSLTGLANRTELYRVLDELINAESWISNGIAVLYIDLDGFKKVNDTYGHDAGDEVLKRVANRLLEETRSTDLVARLSGDEFVLVLHSADKESSIASAESVIERLEQPIIYKGNQLKVGASVGIHYTEDQKVSSEMRLKSADTAMYRAKSNGKGRCVIQNETHEVDSV